MNEQKIRFLVNTWFDMPVAAPGFALILTWLFLAIPGPVKCLTIESPTMIVLFSVDTELGFDWFVVVVCSDLYVEFSFFQFILCVPFHILQSVEVESWITSDEGSQTDLNKLLLVSKSESVVFCFF